MATLKESLKCAVLAFLCSALLGVSALIWRLPKIINRQADDTRKTLQEAIQEAITDSNERIDEAISDLDKQAGVALSEVDTASQNANHRTSEALEIVRTMAANTDLQIGWLRSDVNGQFTALNNTASLAVTPIAEAGRQVDDALPLFLDCEYNPDCLFNRYQGVSKAVEQTAQVIAAEAPKITAKADSVAGSADQIAKSAAREADSLTKPQTKMQQLRSWLLTVARIYGAL